MDNVSTELADVVELQNLTSIAASNHDVDHAQVVEELNSFMSNNPDIDSVASEQLQHGLGVCFCRYRSNARTAKFHVRLFKFNIKSKNNSFTDLFTSAPVARITVIREFDGKQVGECLYKHVRTHAQTGGQVENNVAAHPVGRRMHN